jgi:regulator of cell morphogenesis and NO signaling
MFLKDFSISGESMVADIVASNYRTADVFRKYGISYCCGGRMPLQRACELKGIDPDRIQAELETTVRRVEVPGKIDYSLWDISFLTTYISHIHHHYLHETLPSLQIQLNDFVVEHVKKFPYLRELEFQFLQLTRLLKTALKKEEEEIFPYIRQIAHAHKHQEPYAGLFIKTLRKPVEEALFNGHQLVSNIIISIRQITNTYEPPANACLNHRVILARLRELDNDLAQHIFLEKTVLYPKILQMETELAGQLYSAAK